MSDYRPNIGYQRSIDINFVSALLVDVYGIPALPYPEVQQDTSPDGIMPAYTVKIEDVVDEYDNAPVRYGQKTWGAFWFATDDKGCKMYDDDGKLFVVKLTKLLMPLASLISFSKPKKMTEHNEVIEIYQSGKWSINIQGIIINDKDNAVGHQTVKDQMEAIQEFHDVAGAIGVEGPVFSNRRISRIVTKDLRFDPVQGKPGMMQYSIEAVSDVDFLAMYR